MSNTNEATSDAPVASPVQQDDYTIPVNLPFDRLPTTETDNGQLPRLMPLRLPQPTDEAFALFDMDKDKEMLVSIDRTGKVTYGPNYTPDAAAKIFWENMGGWVPEAQAMARIAELEAAVMAEREACAKIADWYQRTKTAQNIARQIRARPAP